MPLKKQVTTKRGQYHKFRSIRINLVKDATLEKIDSNILRNKPELFEKKKVTFEKRNADPSYFKETLCKEFPSLQGNEFSLWRLGCTNVKNETKTSLIPLPPEIDNAEALCECDELNRSCLYIKLQATPSSYSVSSPQPHSDSSASADEDDSTPSLDSSPKITSTSPDLLPSEAYNQFQSVRQSIITFVEPSQNNDGHHNQLLGTHPWLTDTNQIGSQPMLMPLVTSVSLSEEYTQELSVEEVERLGIKKEDLEHLGIKIFPKVQSSTRDPENRLPKKRKIPPDNAINFESAAYTDVKDQQANDTDELDDRKQTKNSQYMSLDPITLFELGSQQPVAYNYTAALLGDHTMAPESGQHSRPTDISYLHQTYPNTSVFIDLQNNGNEASRTALRWMPGSNNSFGEPLTVTSLPSLPYNVASTSGLQDNAQQGGFLNLISMNAHTSLDHNKPIQATDSLRTDISDVIATNGDSMTQMESQANLIMKHMEFLVDRMDPDFGLLDVLIASKDLTMAEFHQVRSWPSTIEDRNRKLLNYIVIKNKADNLTAALEKAGQKHLVNYLKSDAKFETKYHELWPLSDNELENLITNRQTLIDDLDSSYLSYNLFFKEVINKRQHEYILSKTTNPEKNEALLEMIRRGSRKQYKQTIDGLRELKQVRILNIFQRSEKGLIATIQTKAAEEMQKSIWGLTILDNELFVVHDKSSEVEVYDSLTFNFSRCWTLKELIDPADIVSCHRNKCLYIIDYKVIDLSKEIFRVDPNGKLIKKWSTKIDCGRLSVTYDSTVILAVFDANKLMEYSPDGQLIREIHLSSEDGFCHPCHAIKLTNGHFVVSHGSGAVGHDDDLHRVCIVDADGKRLKSFGGKRGSTIRQTHFPTYLSVDRNGFVMIADFRNSRVLALDSNLEFKKAILTYKHGLQYPERILLDESNGRLFVADNKLKNIRILIFDLLRLT